MFKRIAPKLSNDEQNAFLEKVKQHAQDKLEAYYIETEFGGPHWVIVFTENRGRRFGSFPTNVMTAQSFYFFWNIYLSGKADGEIEATNKIQNGIASLLGLIRSNDED